jgi:hypothetical protein
MAVRREQRCKGLEPGSECITQQSGVELRVGFGYAPITALEGDHRQEKSHNNERKRP